MTNLIDRYVYDVIRRLPEREQDEVGKELRANIYDMIPDNASDDAIRAVLCELGSPALLAEQYRVNPRYLISPAFYDSYLRALKWALPLVGSLMMVFGMIFGGIHAIKDGMTAVSQFIGSIIRSGISTAVDSAIQALLWITAGFAIADRISTRTNPKTQWNIDDLPDEIPPQSNAIPLSDSIVELIIIAFFSILGVMLCLGMIPFSIALVRTDMLVEQLFSNSFLSVLTSAIIVVGFLGIGECTIKIIKRRWTPFVCGVIAINNVTSIGLALYLLSRPDVFHPEFITFAKLEGWLWLDALRLTGSSLLNSPIVMFIIAIIVISALADCGVALYRTLHSGNTRKAK